MSLQPSSATKIDRQTTAPFLLRLYWRQNRSLSPDEFAVAPPEDTSHIIDYSSLLPSHLRQSSVQIYTWPTCSLRELTGLLGSVIASQGLLGVGTRLVYSLIFPDTRGMVGEGGRGRWTTKPLGSVVVGGRGAQPNDSDRLEDEEEDNLEGDADKTLADAKFVIGDYVACTIYPPNSDGRIAPAPSMRGPRDPYVAPRGGGGGGFPPRENGFGGGGGYRGGRPYRGGGRGGGGFGGAPLPPQGGEWRRGERPPPGAGPYRGGRGRPY